MTGAQAFEAQGFDTVDVLSLTRAAVDPQWWLYTSRGFQPSDYRWVYRHGKSDFVSAHNRRSTDIHTHEASSLMDFRDAVLREGCTESRTFPHESRVYGWLSKAITQITLNRVCSLARRGSGSRQQHA